MDAHKICTFDIVIHWPFTDTFRYQGILEEDMEHWVISTGLITVADVHVQQVFSVIEEVHQRKAVKIKKIKIKTKP